MLFEITVLLVLILVNGLFAGAEIATVTVRKTRIEQMLAEGKRGARAIAELRANPERLLATVQIGITVVGATAAAYGGDTLAHRLTPLLQPSLGAYAHQAAFTLVVASISYLSLVLGELVPKSLALRAGEAYAVLVARPLLLLAALARPLVWLLTASSNLVLKLFGDKTSFTEARIDASELKAMLEDASEEGALHPRAGEIAARAIELSELRAVEVMVPRNEIISIDQSATVEGLRRLVVGVAHARFPLVDGDVDQVVGYVSVRDAFTANTDCPLATLAKPMTFVPESMRGVDLLQTLQARGVELAIVVDEHGGTAGLVTRDDLAEELFGEVAGGATVSGEQEIVVQPDGSALVAGVTAVRDVNRALDLRLPECDDWTTMAGLCVGTAGKIPKKGEQVQIPGCPTIEIVDVSARRVRSVRVLMPPATS